MGEVLFYLVRHGKSLPLSGLSYDEAAAVGLDEFGQKQTVALARRLEGKGISMVYSSPLKRAFETAAILGDRLNISVRTDARLKERALSHSIKDDITIAEIRQACYRDFDFAPPDGESIHQGMKRFTDFLTEKRREGATPIIVVSHERVMAAALAALFGFEQKFLNDDLRLAETSLTAVIHREGEFQLVALNDIRHLDGLIEPGNGGGI